MILRMDSFSQSWLVGGVFVLAGIVKGVSGMGLPTVAMSLLGLCMAPAQAAALLVAPALLTNVAQCRGPHFRCLVRRLWPLWAALALATVFGPSAGAGVSTRAASRLLGLVLVIYGLWGLWRPLAAAGHIGRSHGRSVTVLAGAATGLLTALTAVFVMPLVPYLQSLRLSKEEMVQALGLSFTVATLALALRLQSAGGLVLLSPQTALALLAALAGMALGNRIRDVLSGPAFQRSLFLVFIALGSANLMQAS